MEEDKNCKSTYHRVSLISHKKRRKQPERYTKCQLNFS
jgi:hypothetical protein